MSNVDNNEHSLVTALVLLAPNIRKSDDRAWTRDASVRVIDCVLSLNRRYDKFVVPRLDAFERLNSHIRAISKLKVEIERHHSPHEFVRTSLNYNHEERAATLAAVVNWLSTISGTREYDEQLNALECWARQATPSDYRTVNIRGFWLSGFQYMRMLFGADTMNPDIHICRFVESHLRRSVKPLEALLLLERASSKAGISLRHADTTIWESSARNP